MHHTCIETVGRPSIRQRRGDEVGIGTVTTKSYSLCAGRSSARASHGACCATWPWGCSTSTGSSSATSTQHQRIKQLTDNNCLSGLFLSSMLGLSDMEGNQVFDLAALLGGVHHNSIGSLSSWSIIRGSVLELWPVRRWRTVRGLQCL